MKIINLEKVNEKLYYERLNNGLEVYILQKKDFYTGTARFVTKFGGLDLEFVPINEEKMVKMPSGIAHFLEHKLFEQKDGLSVDDFYKKSGSYINAFTNYEKTCYHFSCNNNFKENLIFLLDFVQSPYFTDKNVEKEKGIIKQEALMNLDNPNRKFNRKIYENLFNSLYYDKPVVGTLSDIEKITKEDLYKCYNTFYHPTNMCLLIVTNDNVKDVMNIIKENQLKKTFKNDFKIIKKQIKEELNVKKDYEIIFEKVNQTRVAYSLKLDREDFKIADKSELFYYLDILLINGVGSFSDFNLNLKKNKIIEGNISYDINFIDTLDRNYIKISFYALTEKYEEFINLLENNLKKLKISKEDFNLHKKGIFSETIYDFNNVNGIMGFLYTEYNFTNAITEKSTNIDIKYDDILKVINSIKLDNKSIVIMKPKIDS